ncbi:MAG: HAD family hydrolase [Thermoplasmata archaeon]|nr:MAG: HAD family hydrolase [Thermoplasmata archaeon]
MRGFEAALFDLDGTLIYSKGVIGRCINDTLEHFGYPRFEGPELHDLIGVPLRKALSLRTSDIEPLVDHFRSLYISTYLQGTNVYDGMESILVVLKEEGKKIGVVTLKHTPVAKEVLRGLNLLAYIDAVEGDDDVSELKPSPNQILRICRILKVKSETTVVIGDTSMDIAAGKKANCITIGVLWGAMSMDSLVSAGADFLARNPKELEGILKEL